MTRMTPKQASTPHHQENFRAPMDDEHHASVHDGSLIVLGFKDKNLPPCHRHPPKRMARMTPKQDSTPHHQENVRAPMDDEHHACVHDVSLMLLGLESNTFQSQSTRICHHATDIHRKGLERVEKDYESLL
ncbi:hypothetical protein AVEN_65227-1 [Araneus ventricosus]|uniref:Uncharacterized protein n=1 Tax=Araneus ventricosus TaxID=182803 RepID=A0A4Y2AFM7_ARAVE|nr:hypothetical protein AVEN_65227-1 [Araneus ventricosus]